MGESFDDYFYRMQLEYANIGGDELKKDCFYKEHQVEAEKMVGKAGVDRFGMRYVKCAGNVNSGWQPWAESSGGKLMFGTNAFSTRGGALMNILWSIHNGRLA